MTPLTHPNMFPHAGEAPMQPAAEATDADVGGIPPADAAGPSTPWANPAGSLQRFAVERPSADGAAAPAKRATHADRAIAYLREHGPTTGAALCDHLGVNKGPGITVYISKAMKAGLIVRIDGHYGLPGQIEPSETKDRDAVAVAKQASTEAQISVLEAQFDRHRGDAKTPALKPPDSPPARSPSFTLTVGDAMLLSWPDGAVTIQRPGSFVELNAEQKQLFTMIAALRI